MTFSPDTSASASQVLQSQARMPWYESKVAPFEVSDALHFIHIHLYLYSDGSSTYSIWQWGPATSQRASPRLHSRPSKLSAQAERIRMGGHRERGGGREAAPWSWQTSSMLGRDGMIWRRLERAVICRDRLTLATDPHLHGQWRSSSFLSSQHFHVLQHCRINIHWYFSF